MRLLKIRNKKKRKKPKFLRQNSTKLKRIGKKWRKPRGVSSKLRRHINRRGCLPNPGYGSPLAAKYLHPCGLEEKLVSNVNNLEGMDNTKQCVRISSKVGNKKRILIQKKAEEMKLKVLNKKKIEPKKKREKKNKLVTEKKEESKKSEPKQEPKKEVKDPVKEESK